MTHFGVFGPFASRLLPDGGERTVGCLLPEAVGWSVAWSGRLCDTVTVQ